MNDVARLTADLIAAKKKRQECKDAMDTAEAAYTNAQAEFHRAAQDVNDIAKRLDKETDKAAGVKGDEE